MKKIEFRPDAEMNFLTGAVLIDGMSLSDHYLGSLFLFSKQKECMDLVGDRPSVKSIAMNLQTKNITPEEEVSYGLHCGIILMAASSKFRSMFSKLLSREDNVVEFLEESSKAMAETEDEETVYWMLLISIGAMMVYRKIKVD